ncbi:MAG: AlkZ family DNA glycosylase [Bryobacteraceae bacterium]|nr:AlkZ family DNA glycosylase [Bryobacteraceae bacterium]
MLLARKKTTAALAIGRLAGLQAQQAKPPFVGLWSRLEGFRREDLARAIEQREVVRATLMRATLHLLPAADYPVFRSGLQPALTAAMRSALRDRASGLDVEAIAAAARACFAERPRTFAELRVELLKRFPEADERAMGYLVRTHLPLIVVPGGNHWGYAADAKFADASAWLGRPVEAAADPGALVLRYLAAFGPAAAADAQAWSGLAKLQPDFERLRPRLAVFRDERGRELFDLPDAPLPDENTPAPARLLPGFDNLVLAHKDRTRVISDEQRSRVVTKNLQVLPTFLVDGFVAGTWAVERRKQSATLTLTAFAALPAPAKSRLTEEAGKLVRFVEDDANEFNVRFNAA